MFKYLRLLYRAPAAFIWTLALHFFGIRLQQLFRPKRRCVEVLSLWGRGLAWIMGVRIHPRNGRTGPMGDVIIANHMGFLDVPVLLSFYPAVFIVKIEAARVFFFGKALVKQEHLFVDRADPNSRRKTGKDLMKLLKNGDRVIVFPEGRASPGAKRLPFKQFSFAAAKQLGKLVELCVIDYLPDRRMLEWDIHRPMFGQLVDLFGRRRTDISVEFFPAETVDGDPVEVANRYHDLVQGRLEAHDREREQAAAV